MHKKHKKIPGLKAGAIDKMDLKAGAIEMMELKAGQLILTSLWIFTAPMKF
jgi:hypothetical protein